MTPEQFMECFGAVAEAEGGIAKLRELVIDLSMSGRLPDSTKWRRRELREIAVDFRNGISKRSGNGNPMVVLRLADISGTSTATTNLRKIPLTATESDLYRLERTDLLVIRVNGSKHLVGRFIRCHQAQGHAYSDHLIRVRLGPEILPDFLALATRTSEARTYLQSQTKTTAGQHTVNQVGLGGMTVPVPPLAEQKRIVAKVDQLMAMLDDLEQRQEKKRTAAIHVSKASLDSLVNAEDPDQLARAWERVSKNFGVVTGAEGGVDSIRESFVALALQGRMPSIRVSAKVESGVSLRHSYIDRRRETSGHDGRGRYKGPVGLDNEIPFRIPQGWAWCSLDEITSMVTSGSRGWKKYYSEGGSLFIRSQDIKTNTLHVETTAYVRLPERVEGSRTQVISGDVLLTITGANVGKCAHVEQISGDAYVSQHVALIRPLDPRLSQWIHTWITAEFCGRQLLMARSYGDKPGLNLDNIRTLPIPLPGLDEQGKILAWVSLLDDMSRHLRTKCEAHSAISGKLSIAIT